MDNKYFASYEDIEVHRLMVKDKPRIDAYRNAIFKNEHLFKGKLVMDVGAGTGIISLLLAQVGAKKVYAIEATSLAKEIPVIAEENGFSEIIESFHTAVEDFSLPTKEKVDVIVSEWMGFYLLHESMLPSVLYARDKFLAEDGTLFPSEASLYAAPCSLDTFYKEHFYFWDNVYGFKMSAIRDRAFQAKSPKPEIYEVPPSDLLADPVCIKTFNMRFVSEEDAEFSCTSFVGISKPGNYQGVALWFVCEFDGRTYDEDGKQHGTVVSFSTSPFHSGTHWKQTVIILGPLRQPSDSSEADNVGAMSKIPRLDPQSKKDDEDDGIAVDDPSTEQFVEEDEVIGWKLEFRKSDENKRHYNITLEMLDPEVIEHPIPCPCPMPRCLIIAKMIENEDKEVDATQEDSPQ